MDTGALRSAHVAVRQGVCIWNAWQSLYICSKTMKMTYLPHTLLGRTTPGAGRMALRWLMAGCMSIWLPLCLSAQRFGTHLDAKTGQSYATVQIGPQVWMAKNLDVGHFRNGDPIPEAKTSEEWERASREGKPAWCYYNNDPSLAAQDGRLYNYYAIIDPRGLAPEGFRMPETNDFIRMSARLGNKLEAERQINAREGWSTIGFMNLGKKNSNATGFTATPAGIRTDNGEFYARGRLYQFHLIDGHNNQACEERLYQILTKRKDRPDNMQGIGKSVRLIAEESSALRL